MFFNNYFKNHLIISLLFRQIFNGRMAEWSKAAVLGTVLRAGVQIPLRSNLFDDLVFFKRTHEKTTKD